MEDLQPVTPCFRTVTGQKAPIKGRCNLTVRVGSTTVTKPLWVADIQDPCILGTDFLEPLGCVVNLKDNILAIGDEEVPLQRIKSQPSDLPCYCAVLEQTVNLPPQSESLVSVRIEGLPSATNTWGILEPSEDGLRGVAGIMAGRTLVDLDQPTVPVRMLNLSEKEQRIKSGVAVAVCAAVQSVLSSDVCGKVNCKQALPDHLKDLYQRSVDGLDPVRQQQVCNLLCEFSDVFSKGPQDLGHTDVIQHRINTQDAAPIRQPPRRLPSAKQQEAAQAIEEMKRDGVIEPSVSPWAAPIVLVRKKDGSTRFCVDYRKLSSVTKKDSYPLLRIDDTLEALSGATWFSSLDLKSGYWQVGVHSHDREKTAFTTGRGLWQFRVMPFGLCHVRATDGEGSSRITPVNMSGLSR